MMPRMRTISQAVQCLKADDPDCAVSEHWLRQLVKQKKIKHHTVGTKYLIDLDYLLSYLSNPPAVVESLPEYGRLRKIESS